MLRLLSSSDYEAFMRLAVRSRKNILVSGPTGSGKTTWTKALIREIPSDERLVTIEDAKELVLDRHPNHVRLFYSKDDQGVARVTPKQLLESCLRMKPDRILLAELRAEEAFDYLRNVNSGHPGSITSVHAVPNLPSSSWYCSSSKTRAAASWRATTSRACYTFSSTS
jgi:type IV secretion system protein VirB11